MMMFNSNSKMFMAGLFTLALSACGGGDGGPGTGDVILGTGTPSTPAAVTVSGTFVDAAVNGVTFTGSPSGTTGLTGTNGTAGGFTVNQGDTVTFSIGGLSLGSSNGAVTAGEIITPAELAGNAADASNARAIRIARLLQSLDADGNTSNGITITTNTVNAITALSQGDRDNLSATLISGTNFDTIVGGLIDNLTTGNTVPRAEGNLVSAVAAQLELQAAVTQATGSSGTGGTNLITAAATGNCPVGTLASTKEPVFGQQFPVCVLTANITDDVTLTNDHIYVLQNAINVGDGDITGGPSGNNNAVLTVEPGTQIFGYDGLQTGLVITRGSRINAIGTADKPIIMAAVTATGTGTTLQITSDPADLTGRGQWAGLVLSGRGINNNCSGGQIATEAAPDGVTRFFGCTNNADSSGTVEYVIIAESGLGFRPNQEVQGLTIEAAGSGTRINYLQVLGSEDDGIEWFGGAASASNVVINGADDDSLDMDEGYVGTVQNALVIMGAANGDRGIEADTAGPSNDAIPVSRPNFVNVSIFGNQGSANSTVGGLWTVGFGGAMWRSAFIDHTIASAGTGLFTRGCFDIDSQIDTNTAFRDVAVKCANGDQGTWGFGIQSATGDDALQSTFMNGGSDESGATVVADRRDFTLFTGTINPNTMAIDAGVAPNNPVAPPAGVNGNTVGNYFGAVNPADAAPNRNPNDNGGAGGPWWDGWTYIHASVDGKLPGANFHPLQAEIQR